MPHFYRIPDLHICLVWDLHQISERLTWNMNNFCSKRVLKHAIAFCSLLSCIDAFLELVRLFMETNNKSEIAVKLTIVIIRTHSNPTGISFIKFFTRQRFVKDVGIFIYYSGIDICFYRNTTTNSVININAQLQKVKLLLFLS